MSRTVNSIKNVKYSVLGQIVGLFASFITRMVFVRVLSAEYLGLNGLFTNILSVLSFAELGIGPALVYSMYKPLAQNNTKLLNGLMILFKKAYITIGFLILVLGGALTPFLDFFIKEKPNIDHLELIYILFVFNSALSYFFSYKRSFLIADQKKYLDSIYHYAYLLVRSVLQIIILYLTKNFLLYLIIQVIITLAENINISKLVNKKYPYLMKGKNNNLNKKIKLEIIRNIKAMIFHKLGTVAVMSTDNILIAKYIGIVDVGIYSNYLLIITALNQIINNIFQSLVASVGNMGATESTHKNEFIFRCIDFLSFWIYGFSSIALFSLFNPFIKIWLGSNYIFSMKIVLLIVTSFYFTGRRKSVMVFRDAFGLFWYDRYKPIFESIINLSVSIFLVQKIGFDGIIIGTIFSTLTVNFWVEPLILYKYGFKMPVKKYFYSYIKYFVMIIVIGFVTYCITKTLNEDMISLIINIFITALIPNIIIATIFWRTKEFQYLLNIIKTVFRK